MNNKIKELAKQAELNLDLQSLRVEKFAELIVRECIHVAIHKSDGVIFTADIAGYIAAGRATAATMIKEHFGVE